MFLLCVRCHINHKMNYLQLADIIHQQRRVVYEQIKLISHSHIVHAGLSHWGSYWDGSKTGGEEVSAAPATIPPLNPLDVPGVKETGYVPSLVPASSTTAASASGVPSELSAKLNLVLKHIKQQKDAWPFIAPVDAKIVPDYYVHIAQPMDLQTMQNKLDRFEYRDKEAFHADFKLMINNCKQDGQHTAASGHFFLTAPLFRSSADPPVSLSPMSAQVLQHARHDVLPVCGDSRQDIRQEVGASASQAVRREQPVGKHVCRPCGFALYFQVCYPFPTG